MTLHLDLTQEEERRLHEQAAREGVTTEDFVLSAVKKLVPPQSVAEKLAALRTLLEDDADEQQETGEFLQKALDEDRLSYRKLYP